MLEGSHRVLRLFRPARSLARRSTVPQSIQDLDVGHFALVVAVPLRADVVRHLERARRVTAVVERLKLEEALKDARGDKARAAAALHISYKVLLQKQREHSISD